MTKALDQIAKSAARAIPQVVSMFLPGANAVRGLYNVLRWTLDNRVALGGVFTKIVDSINALAEGNVPNFRAQLLQAMNGAIVPMIGLRHGNSVWIACRSI